MIRWMAVDPGETCGWSVWQEATLQDCGQDSPIDFLESLAARCDDDPMFTMVVCEEYRLRAGQARAMAGTTMITSQIIGAIKWVLHEHSEIDLVMVQPAGKEFITNERLKKAGVYQVGHPHANDSIRHALAYQYHNDMRSRRELL